MQVERLDSQHAADYRALMLEAYESHPAAFTSSAAERAALPLSWWEARLASGPEASDVVFGAFHDGTLAGAVGLSFEPREKGRHKAMLFGLYVRPQFRGRALGRALLSAVLEHARAVPHVLVVQLTVTEGNGVARGLYEGFGFAEFGVEPYAMAVGQRFFSKVHMWCNLKLPVAGGDHGQRDACEH